MYAITYKYKFNKKKKCLLRSLHHMKGGGGDGNFELENNIKLGTKWWSH